MQVSLRSENLIQTVNVKPRYFNRDRLKPHATLNRQVKHATQMLQG